MPFRTGTLFSGPTPVWADLDKTNPSQPKTKSSAACRGGIVHDAPGSKKLLALETKNTMPVQPASQQRTTSPSYFRALGAGESPPATGNAG